MKLVYRKYLSLWLIALNCLFSSCSNQPKEIDPPYYDVVTDGNKITVHSTNLDSLKTRINLQFLTPLSVEFNYVVFDNSAKNQRLSVPGPSDYFLEAVLTYDSTGIAEVIRSRNAQSIRRPQYDHSEFQFDWLNEQDKQDLNSIGDSTKGSPAIIYADLPLIHGGYIITDRKVFLKLSNN